MCENCGFDRTPISCPCCIHRLLCPVVWKLLHLILRILQHLFPMSVSSGLWVQSRWTDCHGFCCNFALSAFERVGGCIVLIFVGCICVSFASVGMCRVCATCRVVKKSAQGLLLLRQLFRPWIIEFTGPPRGVVAILQCRSMMYIAGIPSAGSHCCAVSRDFGACRQRVPNWLDELDKCGEIRY